MKTQNRIGTTITVETQNGSHSFLWAEGDVYLDGERLKTVVSPQLRGSDFWTAEKPYVKICSIINGSFVWWVPSLQEFLEQRGRERK